MSNVLLSIDIVYISERTPASPPTITRALTLSMPTWQNHFDVIWPSFSFCQHAEY